MIDKGGKMRVRNIIFSVCWLLAGVAHAQSLTDPQLFAVDLTEAPPDIKELQREYQNIHSNYRWKYEYRWNMPTIFDNEFQNIITTFGKVEKRIENPDEERILRWLKQLPPEYYPYVGPLLHTMPGLSGKILDLPGIKETKNKFPQRIAAVFEDVPDIEFASPGLYIYLMPEMWGEKSSKEKPQPRPQKLQNPHKIKINPKFVAAVLQNVSEDDFTLGHQPKEPSAGMRHFLADAQTPLSGADVKAFVQTGKGLKNFFGQNQNTLRFIMVDSLIRYQDEKNGENATAAWLKTVVNPCQTIARKAKWLRQYTQFQQAIGAQGFGFDDWAYTCDKALKAYRVYTMPIDYAGILNFTRTGLYEDLLRQYGYAPEELEQVRYHHAAFVQMYTSTPENIDAVKPYVQQLRQIFSDLGAENSGTPLILP